MATWRKVIVSGSDAVLNSLTVGGGTGDTGVTISAVGALTVDGATDLNSTLNVDGTITGNTSLTLDAVTISTAEIGVLDGAGTSVVASKAVIADGSKDVGTIRNLTIDGTFSDGTYTFDTSGNVSGLGTVGCGAITAGGTSTFATAASPDAVAGATLGSTGAEWGHIYIADDSKIQFGNDQDVTIEYDEDGTDELRFAGNAVTFEQAVTFDGTVSLGNATGDTITVLGNSTFSGTTIANLGTVSAATSITATDLIGTNIDGILGADTARAITATTVDATSDFTIDGLVLTADTITNDAVLTVVSTGLTLNASLDIALSADGGNVTMDDGTTTAFDFNVDDVELKIHDDAQVANYASIAVGDNGATTFTTVDADAAAANLQITADGTAELAGTTVTLDSGTNVVLSPAGGSHVKIDDVIQVDSGILTGATSITSTAFVGTLDGVVGGNTPAAGTFTSLAATGNATITGDLTVNGTTTTLATTNLVVQDPFIFAATGSAVTNVDAGLIVQSGSAVDVGSAIYHDKNDQRWGVAKGIAAAATAVTALQHVVTGDFSKTTAPSSESGSYGVGEMWVDNSSDIWVRTA